MEPTESEQVRPVNWPRAIEVPHSVPLDVLEEGWIEIDARLPYLWPLPWFGPTDSSLKFWRQDRRIFVSMADGPPRLAGVLLEPWEKTDLLARELERAERPITVWTPVLRWPEVAALPGAANIDSLVDFRRALCQGPWGYASHVIQDVEVVSRFPNLRCVSLETGLAPDELCALEACKRLEAIALEAAYCPLDVSPLASLPCLRFLDLHSQVLDYQALSRLNQLESLSMATGRALPFDPESSLPPKLRRLMITDCGSPVQNIDFGFLPKLECLTVLQAAVADLTPLRCCHRLRHLSLRANTEAIDLSPLRGLRALRSLDVDECQLRDCSTLCQMPGLRHLALPRGVTERELAKISAAVARLQSLHLRESTGLGDLRCLGNLRSLRSLKIGPEVEAESLVFLESLESLESLWLHVSEELRDYRPLGSLAQLKHLHLWRAYNLADLKAFGALAELQTLKFSAPTPCDLAPIAGLKKLTYLDLTWTGTVDTGPLRELTNLISLRVNCDKIEWGWQGHPESVLAHIALRAKHPVDLSNLASQPHVESLDLSSCRAVGDLEPLARMPNLAALKLPECPASADLSSLAGARRLRSLDLSFPSNDPADWTPLGALRQLQYLTIIESGQPRSSAPLANLTELVGFASSGSPGLKDLRPLSKLRNLRFLVLIGCWDIEDFGPLGEISTLRFLDLGDTKVADLSFLSKLENLLGLCLVACDNVVDPSQVEDIYARGGVVYWGEGLEDPYENPGEWIRRLKEEGLWILDDDLTNEEDSHYGDW